MVQTVYVWLIGFVRLYQLVSRVGGKASSLSYHWMVRVISVPVQLMIEPHSQKAVQEWNIVGDRIISALP